MLTADVLNVGSSDTIGGPSRVSHRGSFTPERFFLTLLPLGASCRTNPRQFDPRTDEHTIKLVGLPRHAATVRHGNVPDVAFSP